MREMNLPSKQRGFLQFVALGLSAVGLGLQVKAYGEAKSAGKTAEQAELLATQESVRRLEKQREDVLGRQLSAAARANIDVRSQSVLEIRAEAMREFTNQIGIEKQIGATRAKTAGLQGDVAQLTAIGQALRTASSIAGQVYGMLPPKKTGE